MRTSRPIESGNDGKDRPEGVLGSKCRLSSSLSPGRVLAPANPEPSTVGPHGGRSTPWSGLRFVRRECTIDGSAPDLERSRDIGCSHAPFLHCPNLLRVDDWLAAPVDSARFRVGDTFK